MPCFDNTDEIAKGKLANWCLNHNHSQAPSQRLISSSLSSLRLCDNSWSSRTGHRRLRVKQWHPLKTFSSRSNQLCSKTWGTHNAVVRRCQGRITINVRQGCCMTGLCRVMCRNEDLFGVAIRDRFEAMGRVKTRSMHVKVKKQRILRLRLSIFSGEVWKIWENL